MKKIYLIILGSVLVLALAVGGYFTYHYFKYKDMKYWAWDSVARNFDECQIVAVDQTHGRTVYLTMEDNSRAYTVEPQRNYVIDLVANALVKCGPIDLKTN